jgi:hypothetical protein
MHEKIAPTKAPVRRLKDLVAMNEKHEVTQREIFDRLIAVELKVDKIETNTAGLVTAFNAAQGAFTVLEWLAKAAKPILVIGAMATAIAVAWENMKAPWK